MESLAKIAQGKFAKTEHNIIITPQEEHSLKLYSLNILVNITKNVHQLVQFENTTIEATARNLASSH